MLLKHLQSCFIFFSVLLISACAVKNGPVYEKDGKRYGVPDGLFKEQWHDFYLRGISYAEGEYWEDAAHDFRAALKQRGLDQRRARTYGMHFIDYFPSRELGIALLHSGKTRQAIQALEKSLTASESARAKYYLNQARIRLLESTRSDKQLPMAAFDETAPVVYTNRFAYPVTGTVSDDHYVSGWIINHRLHALELSTPAYRFAENVSLEAGSNRITLQAIDLTGKRSAEISRTLIADYQGPLAALSVSSTPQAGLQVTGALFDPQGIAHCEIGGSPISANGRKLLRISVALPVCAGPAGVSFSATDQAGNRTSGAVMPAASNANAVPRLPLLASAGAALPTMELPGRLVVTAAVAHAAPPPLNRIELRGLADGAIVYDDRLFLEGTAYAAEGIRAIRINGTSLFERSGESEIAAFWNVLTARERTAFAFSKVISLNEGQNTLTISLTDRHNTTTAKTVSVTRAIPKARSIGSRLSVAIYPFQEHGESAEPLSAYVQSVLTAHFVNQRRFNVLERRRLDRLLTEQQISQAALFDERTAVRLGRMLAAEALLMGDIFIRKDTIEIIARMVDTETSRIIAEKDIYREGASAAMLRESLEGLALKFKAHFPLCEGSILKASGNRVQFDLGSRDAVQRGMRFLAFSEDAPVTDPASGTQLGHETELLGLIAARDVQETFSSGKVIKHFNGAPLQAGHKIISK